MSMVGIFVFFNFLYFCASVPLEEFYQFGPSVGDSKLITADDTNSPEVTLSITFPFFNQQHDSLYVSPNGCVSFRGLRGTFTNNRVLLSANSGVPIIAPFWTDVDPRNGGEVFYRQTTNETYLNRISKDVREYFNNDKGTFRRFQATWIFVVTWNNVSFYGANTAGQLKRNTFQLLLTTNGRHSFAFFKYYKIQWTTGKNQGGNVSTGLGGTPAQIGFSGGNGMDYLQVPAYQTPAVINFVTKSNTKITGKYIFRIENKTIESGGCNIGGSLLVTPRRGTMLGGQKLTMSGPCLSAVNSIKARYGSSQRTYECSRKDGSSVTCITPTFYEKRNLRILVTVTQTNGYVTNYTGKFEILNIANTKPVLKRTNPKRWKSGQDVEVKWEKNQIPFNSSYLRLDIFYLKEENIDLKWTLGNIIYRNLSLDEEKATFKLQIQNSVAVLRLSPANSSEIGQIESVWSDVFPVVPADENMLETMCSNWKNKDSQLQPVMNTNIQDCPCTLRQALLDTARFHDDPLCNSKNRENALDNCYNCLYHGSAHHCIRLNTLGPNGSGRLCCYGRSGNLMDARNSDSAGTVHRYHYFGSNRNIPFLSNFYFDIVPYLQCCVFKKESGSNNGDTSCSDFFNKRPPSDCKSYNPPAPAWVFGDPHLQTLDGLSYTFNGVGEYVYLREKSRRFNVQARMEQVIINGMPKNASVVTSIAARTTNVSDTVEVQLDPDSKADVLINSEVVDFTYSTWIDFEGGAVSLIQNDGSQTKEILVMFYTPKISLQIIASSEVLNVLTIVSDDTLKGQVEGLIGDFDSDITNDLKNSNGKIIPIYSSFQMIHTEFGETWRILQKDSLFTYPIGKNYTTFANPAFQPNFVLPLPGTSLSGGFCSGNFQCLYDLSTTGSNQTALLSKQLSERFNTLEEVAKPGMASVHRLALVAALAMAILHICNKII